MFKRIRKVRRFLALKLWPEFAGQEWQVRMLRASMDGIAAHNKWLRRQYRKELDHGITDHQNLIYLQGVLHTLAAEVDLMVDRQEPCDTDDPCPKCKAP